MYWIVSDVNHGNAPLMATPPQVTLGRLGYFFRGCMFNGNVFRYVFIRIRSDFPVDKNMSELCLEYKKSIFGIVSIPIHQYGDLFLASSSESALYVDVRLRRTHIYLARFR